MAEFILLAPGDFDEFTFDTSGGADGSFRVVGTASSGITGAYSFGSFEVTGTAGSNNRASVAGSFEVVGSAYGHLPDGHAVAEGEFVITTDSSANSFIPQYAFVDGWYYVVGFSHASEHVQVSAGGTIKIHGYAATFNYCGAEVVYEVTGYGTNLLVGNIAHGYLPSATLFAVAHSGPVGTGITEFTGAHGGEYLLTAYTGTHVNAVSKAGTLTASATATVTAEVNAVLPKGTLVAHAITTTLAQVSGTHSGNWTVNAYTGANSSGVLPVGNLVAGATPQVLAQVDAQLPTGTLVAHAYQEMTASAIGTLPALAVVASGVLREVGPHPQFVGHAYIDSLYVYEGYSVTLREGRAGMETLSTAILNCPFEQIVRFGNHYLGAAIDGLFEIGAEDAVDSVIRLAPDDFGTPTLKRPIALRISGRIETYLNVSLSVEENEWLAPQSTTSRGGASNHRARLARGVSGRYFSYTLTNPGGADFELDEVMPENHVLVRQLGGQDGN